MTLLGEEQGKDVGGERAKLLERRQAGPGQRLQGERAVA